MRWAGRNSKSLGYRINPFLMILLLLITILSTVPRGEVNGQEINEDLGVDWTHVNFDRSGTNFNPQNKINIENVNEMEIKWIFPIPEPEDTNLGGYNVKGKGEVSTPLIIDGRVYFATAAGRVYALDGSTGKTLWVHLLELNRTIDEAKELPVFFGAAMTHVHGITYFEGKLLVPSPPCDVYIINAEDGTLQSRIEDMCKVGEEEGNAGKYKGPQSYGPTIYAGEDERIIIAAGGAVDETNRGGRGFFAAYDLDNHDFLWKFFVTPPAGGDPEWGLKYLDRGWIMGIRASSLPRELFINDWGEAGSKGSQAGPNRGQWTVDEESGVVYVGTTHAAPASNGTNRPGPNLFAASILAFQAKTGELLWWHQLVPHDLSDWDCNWNIILATAEIEGEQRKVIYKGCKDGSMNAFDAIDGRLLWRFVPETTKICEVCDLLDPADPESLARPWANYPKDEPFFRNPTGRGGLVSDAAFAYGRVYYGTYNFWDYVRVIPVPKERPASEGALSVPAPEFRSSNTTIYALDASTGEVEWAYFLNRTGYRTSVIASGGLIFLTSVDGNMRALDADSGEEVWRKQFGVGLLMPPSIGADANGDMMLIQVYGGQTNRVRRQVSSAIIAFHVPDERLKRQQIDSASNQIYAIGTAFEHHISNPRISSAQRSDIHTSSLWRGSKVSNNVHYWDRGKAASKLQEPPSQL